MNEKVLNFGPQNVLTGIYTARAQAGAASKPVVLMLNAGLLHHVGPFRLYVELARLLAERGFDVLRMDRSGIGDSDARPGALSEDERAVADVRDAMDAMAKRTGTDKFVLLGLCAGAYHAHMVAAADPRVCGSVFLDGYAYRTKGFHAREQAAKYLDVARVGRFLKRKTIGLMTSNQTATTKASDDPEPNWDIYETAAPPQEVFTREIEAMVGRGTKLLFLFTGGVNYYNSDKQFREMLPDLDFKGCIETEFYASGGHTYPVLEDRQMLVKRVLDWFAKSF